MQSEKWGMQRNQSFLHRGISLGPIGSHTKVSKVKNEGSREISLCCFMKKGPDPAKHLNIYLSWITSAAPQKAAALGTSLWVHTAWVLCWVCLFPSFQYFPGVCIITESRLFTAPFISVCGFILSLSCTWTEIGRHTFLFLSRSIFKYLLGVLSNIVQKS